MSEAHTRRTQCSTRGGLQLNRERAARLSGRVHRPSWNNVTALPNGGSIRHFLNATILVLFLPVTTSAVTIRVPGDQPTIQAGIDAADPGDEVLVAPGIYFEEITLKSGIVVSGEGGAAATRIEGDLTATIVTCDGVSDATLTGFTLAGGGGTERGTDTVGGGILCLGSSLLIRDLVIRECELVPPGFNEGSAGAGIACLEGSSPEIRNVDIEDCRAHGACKDCLKRGGDAGRGGGLYCDAQSSPFVVDCTIVGNRAGDGGGGGIYSAGSSLVVENTLFESNETHGGGGGFAGEGTLLKCSFIDNLSVTRGGGWGSGLVARGRTAIVDCLFFGNGAHGCGGAIFAYQGDVEVIGNTIAFNEADWGAGVYADVLQGTLTLERNIIAMNGSEGTGFGVYGNDRSVPAVVRCNDVWGNQGGEYGGSSPDQAGMNGNISLDPLLCDPTMRDFTLHAGSPCLAGRHPDGVECGLIGALGQGCGTFSVEAVSWAEVKAKYR